jgi:hypothetical protein
MVYRNMTLQPIIEGKTSRQTSGDHTVERDLERPAAVALLQP